MAKLSPKQKKIAAKAGDPNKIEGVDFAKMRQEKEAGVGPMQMTTGNTPPGSYAASLVAKGVKALASYAVKKAKDKVKEDNKPSEMAKKGGKGPKQTNPAPEKENVMQMSDKVGYTMRYGAREKYSPTTFRTDAIMRMGPMLMNHDKPVDTSSYNADTSSAYSKGSFQGSQGENFVTDRNETTSTETEVIPGQEINEDLQGSYTGDTFYKGDYYAPDSPLGKELAAKGLPNDPQSIKDYEQSKLIQNRKTNKGEFGEVTATDGEGNQRTLGDDELQNLSNEDIMDRNVQSKTDDQTIQTTKTEVDESPRTVQVTQATNRELRKQKKGLKKINRAVDKSAKAYEKQLQKFGLDGLDPTSEKYKRRYNRLSQIEKDRLADRQTDYDDARTSKRYFSEGRSQNAFYGDQFNTGERETFAQTDFRNQQNKEANDEISNLDSKYSGTNWKEKFEQDAAKFNSQMRKGLGDLSSLSNLGMPNTTSDSDIISNIFGTPDFGVKPMQFRAQEGSKTSRTGKSKSGGLNRRNNY